MSKKYTNSLKLNLPTGDFCIRVNEELQKKLIKDVETYADKIWDKVGVRVIDALINSTASTFQTKPGVKQACFDIYFIVNTVFDIANRKNRTQEETRAAIEVYHMFRRLPSTTSLDSDLNEYYSELLIQKLRNDLEEYGYDLHFSSTVTSYWLFFNPDEVGARNYNAWMFITPLRMDFISRSKRRILKILQNIHRKLDKWFPGEPKKRA